MDENKLIFVPSERVKSMNRGNKRLLMLLSVGGACAYIGYGLYMVLMVLLANIGNPPLISAYMLFTGIRYIIVAIVGYFLFWLIVRVVLWVYDGYQEGARER